MKIISEKYPVEENENAIAILKAAYQNSDLTLYLGAGVSIGSELPSWEMLVQSMYFTNLDADIKHFLKPFPNYLYAISEWILNRRKEPLDITLRKMKFFYNSSEFVEFIRNTLYSEYIQFNELPDHAFQKNTTLESIVDLIKSSHYSVKGVNAIITYNYDNLLEHLLDKQSVKHQSIWKRSQKRENHLLPVYHVHGYLPFKEEGSSLDELIFDEEQYNNVAHDAFHWGNVVQTTYMAGSVGLMIGLSLSDRNIRRILDGIKGMPFNSRNFILIKRNETELPSDADITVIKEQAGKLLKKFPGGNIKRETKEASEIRSIISNIRNLEHIENTRLLKELRLEPVWYNKHEEIPGILNQLIN